eukprot:3300543-Pleurochrysis_carterae.AAC.1
MEIFLRMRSEGEDDDIRRSVLVLDPRVAVLPNSMFETLGTVGSSVDDAAAIVLAAMSLVTYL